MTKKEIIDHIEGEASISFDLNEDNHVDFATIVFPHFRGMEAILKGKPALDALVITPRVCGICGHAHLMATVRALESAYANAGLEITISQKAESTRELTLALEIIQNHFKWIYLVIMPELRKLVKSDEIAPVLKGAFAASIATKALAIFAGQWPHSSYMVPGGVTCDITHVERIKAEGYIDELIRFFEKDSLGMDMETFLSFETCNEFSSLDSDIGEIEKMLKEANMHTLGFAHDRFITLGKHSFTQIAKGIQTRLTPIEHKFVSTEKAYSPTDMSYAKNALYKDTYYEAGPLSRAMANQVPLIKNIHRRFKDSAYSRVIARIHETAYLLRHVKNLVQTLDLSEPSVIPPIDIDTLSGEGVGIVEAPRGPLIHRVKIEKGVIQEYEIITPTQWNIGCSTKDKLTPAQVAMKGNSISDSLFIFRTFDVCSVCTTH